MGVGLDLMEVRFEEICDDGSLLLNEDYMMNMFSLIATTVDPFADYMQFMFTEKQSKQVNGSTSCVYKGLPYDELRAEQLYPARIDVQQSHLVACKLAEEATAIFLIEFCDPMKVTSTCLSSI